MENFQDRACDDPVSGSGLEKKIMHLDTICPERLDPDPDSVNIRPDPKPCRLYLLEIQID